MNTEQQGVLDQIVLSMRAGRLSRRTFLERALSIGLTAGSATALLEACGMISKDGDKPNIIVWQSEYDAQGIFGNLVNAFNDRHPESHVIYRNGAPSSDNQYSEISQMLKAHKNSIDVISIDIIWLPEFADQGWIIPLDQTVEDVVQQKYSSIPWVIEGCRYAKGESEGGQLYSAPLRVDIGVLYYRSDVTSTPPKTWQDLIAQANEVRSKREDIPGGFVWQGSQQEGLVCDFVEVLAGYGGSILDSQGKVALNRSNYRVAVDALTAMMNWSAISPKDISTYDEESAVVRWQNGFAVFMRNWYNALSQVTDPTTEVSKSAYFTSIPHGEKQQIGYSCVGGWQLGVNAASQNQELAWQFIKEIINDRTTKSLVTSDLLSAHPDDALRSDTSIAEIAKHLVVRPRSPRYMIMSTKIQSSIFDAISAASYQDRAKQRDIAVSALKRLQADLESITNT